jgi:hypothetical protein
MTRRHEERLLSQPPSRNSWLLASAVTAAVAAASAATTAASTAATATTAATTTAVTAASATTTAASAATATAEAATGCTRTRLIHCKRAAIQRGAIHLRDGTVRQLVVLQLNEGKAARLSGVAVPDNVHCFNRTIALECRPKSVV